MIYGYARFSTEQEYVAQIDDLIHAGAAIIFKDKYTDTTANRPEFNKLIDTIQNGDTLIVTRLEQLAVNTQDAIDIVKKMNAKGVTLRILNIGIIDDSQNGRSIFNVFKAFEVLEKNAIVSRPHEKKTPTKAKNPNYHGGMPRKYNKDQIDYAWKLHTQDHMSYSKISKKLGISKATIYRRFRELRDSNI